MKQLGLEKDEQDVDRRDKDLGEEVALIFVVSNGKRVSGPRVHRPLWSGGLFSLCPLPGMLPSS